MTEAPLPEEPRIDDALPSGDPELYGEAYFKLYHTGLGPIAYERSPHWCSFFATIADEIARVFVPNSVLDAGCALGILVESLWDRGIRANGIDISRYAIDNVRPDIRTSCRVAGLADPIEGTFDLVTCIEVLEHLAEPDARAAIANICKVTDTVLFSSTPSDFAEPTHINVCPPIVWIEAFAQQGFGPDLLADPSFLAPHAMIFRRGSPCDTTALRAYAIIVRYRVLCSERLEAIAVERHHAHLTRLAQAEAEHRVAAETQLRVATEAQIRELQAELQAAHESRRAAETLAALESQRHADATAAAEILTAEARLAADARVRAEADASALVERVAHERSQFRQECLQYEAQLLNLQRLVNDLERSNTWRLMRPVRLAGTAVRRVLARVPGRRDMTAKRGHD